MNSPAEVREQAPVLGTLAAKLRWVLPMWVTLWDFTEFLNELANLPVCSHKRRAEEKRLTVACMSRDATGQTPRKYAESGRTSAACRLLRFRA